MGGQAQTLSFLLRRSGDIAGASSVTKGRRVAA